MNVSILRETRKGDKRVAMTPPVIAEFYDKTGLSWDEVRFLVEVGAGSRAGYDDDEYAASGARLYADRAALYRDGDIVSWLKRPQDERREVTWLRPGAMVIGFLDPFLKGSHVERFQRLGVTSISWELLASREETSAMDAFAQMGRLAGLIALERAVDTLRGLRGVGEVNVLVIGSGNAGASAARAALLAGHRVCVVSTRCPPSGDEVLGGADFIQVPRSAHPEDRDSVRGLQRETIQQVILDRKPSVIVTTARRRGEKSAQLITEEALRQVHHPLIIEDLAASLGGNTPYSKLDQTIRLENDVLIRNRSNYPSSRPKIASTWYAQCLANAIEHIFRQSKSSPGSYDILGDPLLGSAVLTCDGQVNGAVDGSGRSAGSRLA